MAIMIFLLKVVALIVVSIIIILIIIGVAFFVYQKMRKSQSTQLGISNGSQKLCTP